METFLDGKQIWREKVDSLNHHDNQPLIAEAVEMSRLRDSAPAGLSLDISEATHAC